MLHSAILYFVVKINYGINYKLRIFGYPTVLIFAKDPIIERRWNDIKWDDEQIDKYTCLRDYKKFQIALLQKMEELHGRGGLWNGKEEKGKNERKKER